MNNDPDVDSGRTGRRFQGLQTHENTVNFDDQKKFKVILHVLP